jgi:hypothetical protein
LSQNRRLKAARRFAGCTHRESASAAGTRWPSELPARDAILAVSKEILGASANARCPNNLTHEIGYFRFFRAATAYLCGKRPGFCVRLLLLASEKWLEGPFVSSAQRERPTESSLSEDSTGNLCMRQKGYTVCIAEELPRTQIVRNSRSCIGMGLTGCRRDRTRSWKQTRCSS